MDPRFASHYVLLKRVSDGREALATIIILRVWKELSKSRYTKNINLANEVAATISVENFWEEVDDILANTEPIIG